MTPTLTPTLTLRLTLTPTPNPPPNLVPVLRWNLEPTDLQTDTDPQCSPLALPGASYMPKSDLRFVMLLTVLILSAMQVC